MNEYIPSIHGFRYIIVDTLPRDDNKDNDDDDDDDDNNSNV